MAGAAGSGGSSGSGRQRRSRGLGAAGTAAARRARAAPVRRPGASLFDDFEDGDAKGWIADVDDGNDTVGNWAVVAEHDEGLQGANRIQRSELGGRRRLAWKDQVLETKVHFVSSASGDAVALPGRRALQSKERYYFLEFQANETDGSLKVRKRVDGSTTDLIPSYKTGMPVGPGTWYTIVLSAVGTTMTRVSTAPRSAPRPTARSRTAALRSAFATRWRSSTT